MAVTPNEQEGLSEEQWSAWDAQIVADQERLGVDEVIRRLSGERGDELSAAMIEALETSDKQRFVKA